MAGALMIAITAMQALAPPETNALTMNAQLELIATKAAQQEATAKLQMPQAKYA